MKELRSMSVEKRDALGIYASIPFCKAKCTFCNFASGVFAAERMHGYVDRLCMEVRQARAWAVGLGAELPTQVDSVYLGGGTPSLLSPELVMQLFAGLRREFDVDGDAEVTVEAAPGQMSDATLEALQRAGMNRLSFGVQSFVDRECAAVGRLHTGADCRRELRRMQAAGVKRLAVDLIVGLPHQTEASWRYTVAEAVDTGVEHVSVYMLEVDEDSRLGRETLAGGGRYGAGELPHEDWVAEWYEAGCGWLEEAGLRQYEISNFARGNGQDASWTGEQPTLRSAERTRLRGVSGLDGGTATDEALGSAKGGESRHNRKYWERKPYLGFGLDAHSMLRTMDGAVRWANPEEMEGYMGGLVQLEGEGAMERIVEHVGVREAFEEALFLGLRLAEGVELAGLSGELVSEVTPAIDEVEEAGLVERSGGRLRLTGRGRMVSNEVFGRLLLEPVSLAG